MPHQARACHGCCPDHKELRAFHFYVAHNRPYAEYRIMPGKMRARRRSRRRTPLISALSECREEGQQIVGWAEAVEDWPAGSTFSRACRFIFRSASIEMWGVSRLLIGRG